MTRLMQYRQMYTDKRFSQSHAMTIPEAAIPHPDPVGHGATTVCSQQPDKVRQRFVYKSRGGEKLTHASPLVNPSAFHRRKRKTALWLRHRLDIAQFTMCDNHLSPAIRNHLDGSLLVQEVVKAYASTDARDQ